MVFIQRYWFPLLIIGILSFMLIKGALKEEAYKKQIREHEKNVERLEQLVGKELEVIDTLKLQDSLLVDDIKEIKVITNEKIKFVDTMSVSDMQEFFADRYPTTEKN